MPGLPKMCARRKSKINPQCEFFLFGFAFRH